MKFVFLILFLSPLCVLAQSEFLGKAYFGFDFNQKPSGEYGHSRYTFDRLELKYKNKINDLESLEALLHAENVGQEGALTPQFQSFFYQKNNFLYSNGYIRLGLISNQWISFYEQIWNYRFLGSRYGAEFLNYLGFEKQSDLGLSFGGKLGGYGTWDLQFTNGEGPESNEPGIYKDTSLFLNIFNVEKPQLFMGLYGLWGLYEGIEYKFNKKERFIWSLGYQEENVGTLMLQWMKASDNSLMLGYSESLDGLIPHPDPDGDPATPMVIDNRIVQSEGRAFLLRLKLTRWLSHASLWEIFGRYMEWQGDKEMSESLLQHKVYGLAYRASETLNLALAYGEIRYQSDYVNQDDKASYMLSAQIKF